MKDDGGPAYPCEQTLNPDGLWNQTGQSGMSLYDFYVGMLLANPNIVDVAQTSDYTAKLADTVAEACIEAKRRREEQEATPNG